MKKFSKDRSKNPETYAVKSDEVVDLDAISHDIIQAVVHAWWALDADDAAATKESLTSVIELARAISPGAAPKVVVVSGGMKAVEGRDIQLHIVDP